MQDEKDLPKTLVEAIKYFSNPDVALEFMVSMRWPDGVVKCPRCDSTRVNFTAKRRVWTCEDCPKRRQFSIKVGTIMEDSPLGLDKWIIGMWLITSAKNGISSYELHRSLGITQKSAWFLGHRVRAALQSGSIVKSKLTGTVQVDESYIGGLARNMHKHTKERRGITGTGGKGKTAVQGLLARHGEKDHTVVVAHVVEHTRGELLNAKVRQYVLKGSEIHTDALPAYRGLDEDFTHKVVDHAECYVKDGVHTNGLENFWSLLKRGIKGTYVSVEPFHLFRYLSEQVFRFNERKHEDGDQGRFLKACAGMFGVRLDYATLTGQTGSASLR
jgi:transposase-like protein